MIVSVTAMMMIERNAKFQSRETGHIIQFTIG
jgi:hypothetical protein